MSRHTLILLRSRYQNCKFLLLKLYFARCRHSCLHQVPRLCAIPILNCKFFQSLFQSINTFQPLSDESIVQSELIAGSWKFPLTSKFQHSPTLHVANAKNIFFIRKSKYYYKTKMTHSLFMKFVNYGQSMSLRNQINNNN